MTDKTSPPRASLSRRCFLGTTGAVGAALGVGTGRAAAHPSETGVAPDAQPKAVLTINGQHRALTVEPRTTLVEALRDRFGLTGTKIGCNQGHAGPHRADEWAARQFMHDPGAVRE